MPGERFLEGLDAELRAERVRQPPRQHGTAHPVHDHRQVEEALGHRDVGDVRAPDLIDPLDRDPAEQVGVDLVGHRWLARARSLVDRHQAGEPHQALDPFAVDDMALGRQPRRHPPRAVIRPGQVVPIDQRHDRAVFCADLGRPAVDRSARYRQQMGAPSLPPGRYFRMQMVGYFEGIASERGIAWRCSDSYSLRDFLRLENREAVSDHSWLSKTRSRLPHEVHESVFGWVLKLVAEQGLVKGKRIGVDASTMEANAALRTIVRREDGRTYREMLTKMAKESGIETPTADDLVRIDRNRKGKKLSNGEWISETDPEAKIAKLKDGRTHLA